MAFSDGGPKLEPEMITFCPPAVFALADPAPMIVTITGELYDVVVLVGAVHRFSTQTVHLWPVPTPGAAVHCKASRPTVPDATRVQFGEYDRPSLPPL